MGIFVDNELLMKNHILHVIKTCNYHLMDIELIRKHLNKDALKTVICNHILSKLDYCNLLYYGLPKKLQSIQNRAARLIKGLHHRERITPVL